MDLDSALNEAMVTVPDAFRAELDLPGVLAENDGYIIGERKAIPVRDIEDILEIVGEEKPHDSDYKGCEEGWHPECCAFFRSFHFWPEDWGIFIRMDCLIRLASDLQATVGGPFKECLNFVFLKLLYHEKYHYKIALLALMAELCTKQAIYVPYSYNVYQPTYFTNDNLEEGLANAFALKSLPRAGIKNDYYAKMAWLEKLLASSPPGYNQYKNYLGINFRTTEKKLTSQLITARHPSFKEYSPLQDFIIASGHKFWNLELHGKLFLCF